MIKDIMTRKEADQRSLAP